MFRIMWREKHFFGRIRFHILGLSKYPTASDALRQIVIWSELFPKNEYRIVPS